jgi:hypothetical protein
MVSKRALAERRTSYFLNFRSRTVDGTTHNAEVVGPSPTPATKGRLRARAGLSSGLQMKGLAHVAILHQRQVQLPAGFAEYSAKLVARVLTAVADSHQQLIGASGTHLWK